jgi:hypothetical protein
VTSRLLKKIKSVTGRDFSSKRCKTASLGTEAYSAPDDTRFAQIFSQHEGRYVTKWDQYLPVYDEYIGAALDKFGPKIKLLEIGVFDGGSLELWRKFLGNDATIFGVDIDPRCANLFEPPNQVRIGSQDDAAFLDSVVSEMGGVEIVLDDGSHYGRHQEASLRHLFPKLPDGGIYIIEDLHAAYWPSFEGGYRRPGSGIEIIKSLIDDMHHNYHDEKSAFSRSIASLHIFDSIAVIEKRKPFRFMPRSSGKQAQGFK